MFWVVFPAMKTTEGARFGVPCRGEGRGDGGEDGGRGGDKGGRGGEGGSAQEETSTEGFRGSEGMMDCTGVDLQRERSVVGWLLAFKLSSSLPAKFGCPVRISIPLICSIYRNLRHFLPFPPLVTPQGCFRCPLVTMMWGNSHTRLSCMHLSCHAVLTSDLRLKN